MEKFLQRVQASYNYSDYEIKLIRYFFLTMASEISKLIIIFTFFGCIGRFSESLLCTAALLILRMSGGGFHCEHYITCLLTSFLFVSSSVFLAEIILPPQTMIFAGMIFCIITAYKMVPVVSHHRPKPSQQLIKQSRTINFIFLLICLFAVTLFHTNHYMLIIFWLCMLHTVQLLITKIQKGGKYYVI